MTGVIPSAPLGTDAAADRSGLGAATGAPPQGGAAERRFRFELAAHPGSVARARRLTHARLSGWSVCADTCDDAALVMSELVTNAVVHTASSRVVCELHEHGDMVRIAVHDEGCAPGEPHPSAQRPDEEHGRGLLLVDALCRAWGAQGHGPGLLVWAELSHRTDTAHDTSEPRGDLGWGARPKPGRPDDSGDDQQAEADGHGPERHRQGEPEQHREEQSQPHRPGMPEQPGPEVPEQQPGRQSHGRGMVEQFAPGVPEQHRPGIPEQPAQGASQPHRPGIPEQHRHAAAGQHLHRAADQQRHPAADGHQHVSADQRHRPGKHPEQHRYAAPGQPLRHTPGQYRRGERA
ncbi:ATP-binding protein [Streptomyces sp. NPDC058299]|uniref:ATP-binding protein n=1 Tax=Streptomyces sp. NPDC058299 TaxID=3346435 RepID=UPI0036E8B004